MKESIDSVSDSVIESGKRKYSSTNTTTTDETETTDDLLQICGDSGWWQVKIYFFALFAGFPSALQDFVYIFLGHIPDHTCKLPYCPESSYDYVKNLTIPLVWSDGKFEFEKCYQYSTEDAFNSTCSFQFTNDTESCSAYDYDTSFVSSTIVTEFNLVCGDEFWTSTSQAAYAMGSLTGSIIFGIVSDNYGRKKAILFSLLISIIFGPLVSISPNYTMMVVARYFLAIGSPAIYDITYILILEMISPDFRGLAGNVFGIPYALGYAAVAGFAYFIRDWRTLQLVLTIPAILFFIVMYFFVPESPRFLISKGKNEDAEKILREIAKTNKKELPKNFSQMVLDLSISYTKKEDTDTGKNWTQIFSTFWDLYRTPKMRTRNLVLNFTWSSVILVYFGVGLNAPNLSANLFIYTFLSGILEVPSYLMVTPLIKYLGRRLVFSAFLFICGSSLALSLLFETGSTAIVAFALVGIFFIGGAYSLMFLYAIELMPTSHRTYSIGFCAVLGKIGSASAPYVTNLMGQKNKKVPTIIFAVVSFVAAVVSLLLPETKDKKLSESIEEVENS